MKGAPLHKKVETQVQPGQVSEMLLQPRPKDLKINAHCYCLLMCMHACTAEQTSYRLTI